MNAAEEALAHSSNPSLQIEADGGSRRTSSSSSSRSGMPKSRSSTGIASGSAAVPRALDKQQQQAALSHSAAPPSRHVKRRSLLGTSLDKDNKPASPVANRTPLRGVRRVSSPAGSQASTTTTTAPVRRTSKSITAASARRESALAEDASKPVRPKALNPPATVTATSKMSKSTTMPSLNQHPEERKRRESVSASSSRRATPVDDTEARADQEMAQYVRRVTSKKLAAGVPSEEIRTMFEFPEPQRPTRAMSARGMLLPFAHSCLTFDAERRLVPIPAHEQRHLRFSVESCPNTKRKKSAITILCTTSAKARAKS